MTDEFLKIIDERINQKVKETSLINSAPCRVIEITNDGEVVVELITDGTRYTLQNYSGNALYVGENAVIYYRGKIIGNGAYIGASLHKGAAGDFEMGYVTISSPAKTILESGEIVAQGVVEAFQNTTVSLNVSMIFQGTSSDTISLALYVDDKLHPYSPITSISNDQFVTVGYSLPLSIAEGEHDITIRCIGLGRLVKGVVYVSGQHIKMEQHYDDTTDDDYIYETGSDYTDILYYIGDSTVPAIPETINGQPVRKIYPTAFNYTDVEAVYIPDGVIEIG